MSLFPDFEKANALLDTFDDMRAKESGDGETVVDEWLALAAEACGVEPHAMFSVPSLPPDSNWVTMDPIEELQKMAPDKPIIVVKPEEE